LQLDFLRHGRGQINVEYIVTMTLFITMALYFATQVMQRTPIYLRASRTEYLQSEAYQISELLINNMGEPANWETIWQSAPSSVMRLGLSSGNKTNLLSVSKVQMLGTACGAAPDYYNNVRQRLGVESNDYQISLFVKDIASGVTLLDCMPTQIVSRQGVVTFKRLVALSSGDYGELTIQAW
jgi:hypothetical protein